MRRARRRQRPARCSERAHQGSRALNGILAVLVTLLGQQPSQKQLRGLHPRQRVQGAHLRLQQQAGGYAVRWTNAALRAHSSPGAQAHSRDRDSAGGTSARGRPIQQKQRQKQQQAQHTQGKEKEVGCLAPFLLLHRGCPRLWQLWGHRHDEPSKRPTTLRSLGT